MRPEYLYSRLARPALERIDAGQPLRDSLIDWLHFPRTPTMAQYTGYVLADLMPGEGGAGWAKGLPETERVVLARWLRSSSVLALPQAVDWVPHGQGLDWLDRRNCLYQYLVIRTSTDRAMIRNTSIVLGAHLDDFVAEQVRAGGYASASEVVRAGLRLLEAADARTRALRQALIEGETSRFADYDYDSFVASLDSGA